MIKQIMICGVDCHQGDAHCNNYCTNRDVPAPPPAPHSLVLQRLKADALKKLTEAEKAMYLYAGECEVGEERTRAFEIYGNIRTATRV